MTLPGFYDELTRCPSLRSKVRTANGGSPAVRLFAYIYISSLFVHQTRLFTRQSRADADCDAELTRCLLQQWHI